MSLLQSRSHEVSGTSKKGQSIVVPLASGKCFFFFGPKPCKP